MHADFSSIAAKVSAARGNTLFGCNDTTGPPDDAQRTPPGAGMARRDRSAWAAMYERRGGHVFGLVYHLLEDFPSRRSHDWGRPRKDRDWPSRGQRM
jgi:hypothetical protein